MTTARTQRGRGVGVTPAWSGTLEDRPLAELIRRIVLEERSGELRVAAPPAVKTISFDRGFIVYASSNLESEGLGSLLVESGRISKHELALVGMLTRAGKQSLRQSLVQGGIVSEEELGRYVAVQVNDIVLSLFSLLRGTYRFQEGPCATPIDLMVSLSAHRILLEGIRRMSSGKLILAGLPMLKVKVKLVDEPPFSLDVDKLRPVEKAVLRLAHQGLSIGKIVNTVGEDKGKALRACYSLYAAGVLEPVTREALRPRPIQEETGSFLVSEILRKVQPAEETASATPATTGFPSADLPAIPPEDERAPLSEKSTPHELPTLAALEEQDRERQGEQERQESSGGLSNLMGALGALWSSVVAWFAELIGTATRSERAEEELTTDEREQATADFGSSDVEAGATGLATTSTATEPSEMSPTVEAVGVPSWSMIDEPGEDGSPPPPSSIEEPANLGVGVPSWSMKDTPNEDAAAHASSPSVEESDYHEPVVESLGVPKWSLKDAPEETAPKRRTGPILRAQEPEPPLTLGVEDEDVQTPASRYQPDLVDSSPILEDDLVALEPEENLEHSMLDAIPLEELTREEESPELLIMIDEDAFADVPEFGQNVAPMPHEEPSSPHIQTEVERADMVAPKIEAAEVSVSVESDGDAFEPKASFEPEPVFESEPDAEPEPVFAAQTVHSEASDPSISIEDDDDQDVEFDVEPSIAEAPVSRAEQGRVVSRSTPAAGTRVTTPPSRTRRVASETPPPSRNKPTVAKQTSKAAPQAPKKKASPAPKGRAPKEAKEKARPSPERETPPAPKREIPADRRPGRSPVPIQPTADRHTEVSMAPSPAQSSHPSNEDVVRAEVQLLRDVKLHFKVRDWAGAVPLLERLVKLSPENALYRGMLGRAMTARPELRNNAEKHFIEALRLSPQNPELHYWLGLYYKSFGLESRAFNEFRTTLRIEPQHAGARKQLATAGKRGAGAGMLKKLFG